MFLFAMFILIMSYNKFTMSYYNNVKLLFLMLIIIFYVNYFDNSNKNRNSRAGTLCM